MGRISPVFGLFRYLRAHFLDVEGNGEEGKVHRDLVLAKVAEAAVCHVELHLSEYGFRLGTSSSPEPETFFRCQQFACFPFVLVEPVVHLDCALVTFGLVALAPQRASFAVLCAVTCVFAAVAACGLRVGGAGARHALPHRAYVIT